VLVENTEILSQPLQLVEQVHGLEPFEVDYMDKKITAKDISLPPFIYEVDVE